MNVSIKKEAEKFLVTLVGRVDTTNAEQFQKDLQPLMEAGKTDIEINCNDMEYTSSQGLRIFLLLQKSVSAQGGSMVLTQMKPQVKEVFDITGFSNIIKIK